MEFSAKQIAQYLEGEVIGNPEEVVKRFSKIEEAELGSLSFLSNKKYENYLYTTKASVVLINRDFVPTKEVSATLIKVNNAYESLASLLTLYDSAKPKKIGISPKSDIDASASIGDEVFIGAFTSIGEDSRVGNKCRIYQNCNIGDHVSIGENVLIYPGVTIYEGCIIGDNCILHAGVVIGSDGFGFAQQTDANYKKIPQIGIVILKENVEVGANTTIDRATMGNTIIHQGAKLDNLIQIGHNVEVGENTVICAQVGVAGSTKIGDKCVIGGQTGINGHISICNNTMVGAQSGIANTVKKEGTMLLGTPATSLMDQKRAYAVYKNLPEMSRTLFQLKKELDALTNDNKNN